MRNYRAQQPLGRIQARHEGLRNSRDVGSPTISEARRESNSRRMRNARGRFPEPQTSGFGYYAHNRGMNVECRNCRALHFTAER